MSIPVEASKAERLIAHMGWAARPSGTGENLAVQTCPFCGNTHWKFYIAIGGEKDGLWDCKLCGEQGNLFQLKQRLGISVPGITSIRDLGASSVSPETLPDFDALHRRLLNDEDVLDYLIAERKFTMTVIERLKIGVRERDGKKWVIIPYFDLAGNPIFYKARTVPPAAKEFDSPRGRECPLFNESVIRAGMDELVMVEGESDAIALLSQGYETVVGIPGAGLKKAALIEKFDRLHPKKIYLLYDCDRVGQAAARAMATRIGIERVWNIALPEFHFADATGIREGKDINEWFVADHTLEDFHALKATAMQFDVQGVQNLPEVLGELKDEITGQGVEPTYRTPWPELTRRMGGAEPGDLIGIIAEGKIGKTTMALNWLEWLAEQGVNVLMFCQEMQPRRLVRKWVSHVTGTDDTPGRSQITSAVVEQAVAFAGTLAGDLLFGFTKVTKADEVFETIRQAVRRYDVKVVCFDNLQLLVTSIEHAAQQTSTLTKRFKALAMELNIVILLVVQPNRVAEGQIVAARNAMGSSAIEKDVDTMICLHRNRVAQIRQHDFKGFLDTEENFEPHLLVRVDLSRYAPGGVTTLWMDGATSTIRQLRPDDLTTIEPPKVGPIPVETV